MQPTQADIKELCERYVRTLPIPETTRNELADEASRQPNAEAALAFIHASLAEPSQHAPNPTYASIKSRLSLAYAETGDNAWPLTQTDQKGRVRLHTVPPLERASMVAKVWSKNPFKRGCQALLARLFGRRGHFAVKDDSGCDNDVPAAKHSWKWAGRRRRLLLLLLIAVQTLLAVYFMTFILPAHGRTLLEGSAMVLYTILFVWISFGFWTAMMGFWVRLTGWDKYNVEKSTPISTKLDETVRCALVMPICNEDTARVYAGLRATYESVAKTDAAPHFDFFILSDTSDADTRVAELAGWRHLCAKVHGFGRIFYRHRSSHIKRKSGNIGDFCRRWGNHYRYMVVMDADSVMSGDCLKRLLQIMEVHPNAGIVQTSPRAVGQHTLYARMQQFATRIYGPLFTAGLHFWQLGESHYWGHNAIIRLAPFIRHCALGHLPGRGALAGEILSHDFVEAALMRRAGWAVWIAHGLSGSYEEMPPNLLDELKRDRRWCQGNLMNFRLFFTKGLKPAHRAMFMTGVMAYLSAPLWFLFLLVSTVLLSIQALQPPEYFTQPYQLFPTWPEWHPDWAIALFSATLLLLFIPKILAVLLPIFKGAKLYAGGLCLLFSMLLEFLFSALLAPVRMLFHSRFVMAALLGITVKWQSPQRDSMATSWQTAIKRHAPDTILGLIWAAWVYWVEPVYLGWLAPIVGALILSIPVSVYSSRLSWGRAARKLHLFIIPEESQPPAELVATLAYTKENQAQDLPDFKQAVNDPIINALVCADAKLRTVRPLLTRTDYDHLIARVLLSGPDALDNANKARLLEDPLALGHLHIKYWARQTHV